MGVKLLLEACHFHVATLDGADGEDNAQLLKLIKQIRRTPVNTEGQRTALLLDDFESFTDKARKDTADVLTKTAPSNLACVIITVTQRRDPKVKDIQTLDHVQLYKPKECVLRDWFEKKHPWSMVQEDGSTSARRGFGSQLVRSVGDLLQEGDVSVLVSSNNTCVAAG